MKLILTLLIAVVIGPALQAQVDRQEELFCQQVVALVRLAPTDYRENHGTVLRENEAVKIYNAAVGYPDLHAANQGINVSKNGKAPFYRATYIGAEEVNYAQTAFLGIADQLSHPGKNDYAGFTADAVLQKDEDGDGYALLFYNGLIVAKLEVPAKRESASILIGLLFSKNLAADKLKLSAAPVAQVKPQKDKAQDGGSVLTVNNAQLATHPELFFRQLVALVHIVPTDFRDNRGTMTDEDESIKIYTATAPYRDLHAAAQYIGVPKDGTPAYYFATYVGEEAIGSIQTAFLGLATMVSRREDLLLQGKNEYEGFSADAVMRKTDSGAMIAYLIFKETVVAKLYIPAKRGAATLYIGIINSKNPTADRSKLSPVPTQPDQVTVAGTTITIKGLGPHFDGSYDIEKLPPDGCVSGNCSEGNGRKVIASITAAGPRIRILDGKFANRLYSGEGEMLIDGEGPVLDGTYEVGKFKVDPYAGLQAKTTFHPKYAKGAVKGNLCGYYDYAIGSDKPAYRQYVRGVHSYKSCEFAPEYHDKPTAPVTEWERDIYQSVYTERMATLLNSGEFQAAQAVVAAERERDYGPQGRHSNNTTPAYGSPGSKDRRDQSADIIHGTHNCIPCDGKGWVRNPDGNGGFRLDVCTRCKGQGQVSN